MATRIGLDFGTHQTKICVVDRSDKRNLSYRFFHFTDLKGEQHRVLPSVVQLNKDNTLSYGYVDTSKAKLTEYVQKSVKECPTEPSYYQYRKFPTIQEPVKPLEEEAGVVKKVFKDFASLALAVANTKKYKEQAKNKAAEKARYEVAMVEYRLAVAEQNRVKQKDKEEVDKKNAVLRSKYEAELEEYNKWMEEQKELEKQRMPIQFRNFKQLVFSSGINWDHKEVEPMIVSIWYLCYVFFLLDEAYGTGSLIVSMGTSSGPQTWERNKRRATEIILTVYDLIDNVFKHDKNAFLSATIDDLLKLTHVVPFSEEAKEDNAIFVFPEAIANIQPLAQRRAFTTGLNLLVDIGGGTVDISLFSTGKGTEPSVYDYASFPNGVNSIDLFGKGQHYDAVKKCVNAFSKKISDYARGLGVPDHEAHRITQNRTILFTGGGSGIKELCKPYAGFDDVIRFSQRFKDLVPSSNIEDLHDELHVLSVSLGLAMATLDDSSVPLQTYEILFSNVADAYAKRKEREEERYIHGLTDL